MMKRGIIYMYHCIISGKSYIGKTVQPKIRKRLHLNATSRSRYFNNAIKKYGKENFKYSILESGIIDSDKLNKREKFWIKKYDTYHNGYNLTKGGDGIDSEVATKRAIELKNNKTWIENITKANRERGKDPEYRKKRSEIAQKLAKNPEWIKTNAKAMQKRSESKLWKDKIKIRSAKKSWRKNQKAAMIKLSKSKEWRNKTLLGIRKNQCKAVVCIETNKIYYGSAEAGRQTGCYDSLITRVVKGKGKTTGGHHWRYATQKEIDKANFVYV